MKILVCSDVHLGRVPAIVTHTSLDGVTVWESVVQTAISQQVDALVLAGDVIDQDDAWYEAYGPLVKNINELNKLGIQVLAVAGNHDAKVFPKLVHDCPHVKLLGLGGNWEFCDLNGVRFLGWSFPSPTYMQDPFTTFNQNLLDTSGPILGILHGEVNGQPGASRYAPVPSHRLQALSKPYWVLGHIHKQRMENNWMYCGSPFALDSSEKGPHGVWLIENEENGWKAPQFIQLCPYRLEDCEVVLDLDTDYENINTYIIDSLKTFGKTVADQGFFGTLYCHLIFTGTVKPNFNLQKALTADQLQAFEIPLGESIEISPLGNYEDRTELEIDLEQLAKGVGLKALLAQKLLHIQEEQTLIRQIGQLEKDSYNTNTFSLLKEPDHVDNERIERLIRQAGIKLLRAIISQGDRNA